MSTTAEKLATLLQTKANIKSAIIEKGQEIADDTPFSEYADKIRSISSGNSIVWEEGGMLPSGSSWSSVAYGNGKFVAMSKSGVAAYSSDGITWKSTTLPVTNIECTVYGGGKFVAIPNSNSVFLYSTDGITWKTSTVSNSYWYSITYGNGKFVAVGSNNKIAYSADGINWQVITLSYSGDGLLAVTFGNDKFVAVGDGTTGVYSEDGVNWAETSVTNDVNDQFLTIVYGDGVYIAPIYNSTKLAYSYDGIVWNQAKLPCNLYWWRSAFGNETFIITDGDTPTLLLSSDGISWNVGLFPRNMAYSSITYGDGKFVAISSGRYTAYSVKSQE